MHAFECWDYRTTVDDVCGSRTGAAGAFLETSRWIFDSKCRPPPPPGKFRVHGTPQIFKIQNSQDFQTYWHFVFCMFWHVFAFCCVLFVFLCFLSFVLFEFASCLNFPTLCFCASWMCRCACVVCCVPLMFELLCVAVLACWLCDFEYFGTTMISH